MRLVPLYWVHAGRRVIEAQEAQGVKISVEDAQFLTDLFSDIEIARYSNGPIFLPVEELRRLHSLIPGVKPITPVAMNDKELVQAIGAPKDQAAPVSRPMSMRDGAPLVDITATQRPVDGESSSTNVVEMHPALKPEDIQ